MSSNLVLSGTTNLKTKLLREFKNENKTHDSIIFFIKYSICLFIKYFVLLFAFVGLRVHLFMFVKHI